MNLILAVSYRDFEATRLLKRGHRHWPSAVSFSKRLLFFLQPSFALCLRSRRFNSCSLTSLTLAREIPTLSSSSSPLPPSPVSARFGSQFSPRSRSRVAGYDPWNFTGVSGNTSLTIERFNTSSSTRQPVTIVSRAATSSLISNQEFLPICIRLRDDPAWFILESRKRIIVVTNPRNVLNVSVPWQGRCLIRIYTPWYGDLSNWEYLLCDELQCRRFLIYNFRDSEQT